MNDKQFLLVACICLAMIPLLFGFFAITFAYYFDTSNISYALLSLMFLILLYLNVEVGVWAYKEYEWRNQI